MSEFECNHGELVGSTGGCGKPDCRIVRMDGMTASQLRMQERADRYAEEDNDDGDCEDEDDGE